jgi:hypothetical protein
LVLAMFPDSDALLSCNHHSNAGSACLLNIAQEGSVELDTRIVVGCAPRLFLKLSNSGQTRKARHRNLDALTRRESSATLVGSISSMWRSLGEQVSTCSPNTALCATSFLMPPNKGSDGDAQIRHLLAVIRKTAPFSSQPAPPTTWRCYERSQRW